MKCMSHDFPNVLFTNVIIHSFNRCSCLLCVRYCAWHSTAKSKGTESCSQIAHSRTHETDKQTHSEHLWPICCHVQNNVQVLC